MPKTVCVFCSSSDKVVARYGETAEEVGAAIALSGSTLLYGGEDVGLMGVLARSTRRHRGKVYGVVTELMKSRESVNFGLCDEITVVRNFRERKAVLVERSDLFVVLPGGFGTLDEAFEILYLRQVGGLEKPLYFIDALGHYDQLQQFFTGIYRDGFCTGPEPYRFLRTASELSRLL